MARGAHGLAWLHAPRLKHQTREEKAAARMTSAGKRGAPPLLCNCATTSQQHTETGAEQSSAHPCTRTRTPPHTHHAAVPAIQTGRGWMAQHTHAQTRCGAGCGHTRFMLLASDKGLQMGWGGVGGEQRCASSHSHTKNDHTATTPCVRDMVALNMVTASLSTAQP